MVQSEIPECRGYKVWVHYIFKFLNYLAKLKKYVLDFEASERKLNDCPFKIEKNRLLKDLMSQERKRAMLFAEHFLKFAT
jgi:hypothetical protein